MIDHAPLKATIFANEQRRTGAYYDGEVLGLSPDHTLILWDREGECAYDCGEPLTERFQLTDREAARVAGPDARRLAAPGLGGSP